MGDSLVAEVAGVLLSVHVQVQKVFSTSCVLMYAAQTLLSTFGLAAPQKRLFDYELIKAATKSFSQKLSGILLCSSFACIFSCCVLCVVKFIYIAPVKIGENLHV